MAFQETLFQDGHSDGPYSIEGLLDGLGVSFGPNYPNQFGQALRKWSASLQYRPVTLSLFSGAGGLDIGFHDAGFEIVEAVEIDPKLIASLQLNSEAGGYLEGLHPKCMDIREYSPKKNFKVDFIIGGPPCQTFSAAGRRAAGVLGTTDQRGTLFEEYVRLLNILKPKGFLFENVYGITGADSGKAWDGIRVAFESAGYTINFRVLDAADFGVPQHRERIFIVGFKKGKFQFPRPTHGPDSPTRTPHFSAGEALEGIRTSAPSSELKGRYGHLLKEIPEGLNYSYFTEKMGHPNPIFAWRSKFSDFLYKADRARPIRTLKAQGGQYTGPFHWDSRPFSIAELKRLQTFPDDYEIVGGYQTAMHQIGNSVPPQIARIMALAVLNQLFEIQIPGAIPMLEDWEKLTFRQRKQELTQHYAGRASAAISKLGKRPASDTGAYRRKYRACLTRNFDFSEDRLRGTFYVQVVQSKGSLKIRIDDSGYEQLSSPAAISIQIKPVMGRRWALPVESVSLSGGSLSQEVFSCLWKAFEAELIQRDIKADLVQLCEYYQYEPRFEAQMKLEGRPSKLWKVLTQVVAGVGTRRIIGSRELSEELGLSEGALLKTMEQLRNLGYEVRNSKTNPQIARDHFLIPYAFPTLTSSSVQLSKNLV